MSITRADVMAAFDVVTQLTDEIDDLDVNATISFREDIEQLQKASKLCHELLTAKAVTALDGQPIQIGDKVYAAKPGGKWRVDHPSIRSLIQRAALVDRETGELRTPEVAVRAAIELMYQAFVSPASFPKQEVLKALAVTNKHVGTYERGAKTLKITDVGGPQDD